VLVTAQAPPPPPAVGEGQAHRLRTHDLPYPLVVAAAWAWRLIVVAVALAALVAMLRTISLVVVPIAVALLLSVLLWPAVRGLTNRTGLSRGVSALIMVIALITFVVGLLTLTGTQIAAGMVDMRASAEQGLGQITDWLRDGPLHVSGDQLQSYLKTLQNSLRENQSALTSGVLAAGTSAGHFLIGMLVSLIATFFFLAEGDKIWRFVVRMLPAPAQEPTYQASRRGWVSLGSYARTQVLVAGVDAVGIGLGALVLGLPFVVPLTLLVFLSSFIPIVGAIVSGAVAVLVALVVKGPVIALIMLGVVLLVQQLESHVLQPFLMGKAVALHPLAVIAAVAIGSYLLGIVGALFAVPFLAVLNSVIRYYYGQDQFPDLGTDPMPAATVDEHRDPKAEHHVQDVEDGEGVTSGRT
jgi:predicted PurR-regulated permease PerM